MSATHAVDPNHSGRSKCGLVWWSDPEDPRRSVAPTCWLCAGKVKRRGGNGGWAERRARTKPGVDL